MKIPIPQILVGERHRKEMGDLAPLAASIAEVGLLQPIGVTQDNRLVFGERRLRACHDILGLADIEAIVVDVPSIVEGEWAENEIRKDFTVSERVAIAQAVEAEIGERRGRDNPKNISEYKGTETRDIAAKKAGFGNPITYKQAEAVVLEACPELAGAMDDGTVSISAAAKIAKEPVETQRRVVKATPAERRQFLRVKKEMAREKKPYEHIIDLSVAVEDIASNPMTAAEIKLQALPHTLYRIRAVAPKVIALIKELQVVNHDEKRAS